MYPHVTQSSEYTKILVFEETAKGMVFDRTQPRDFIEAPCFHKEAN